MYLVIFDSYSVAGIQSGIHCQIKTHVANINKNVFLIF